MSTLEVVYARGQIDREPGERWVTMTNAVARAGSGLSLSEKRLVIAAVAKLDSRRSVPAQCPSVKITAQEYGETYGLDSSTAYVALRDAASALFERKITFFEQPGVRRLSKNKRPIEHRMRWVGSAKYHEGEGWVELSFWHEVVPHLMGLRQHFTTYQLQQAHALRSVYSWKMLEFLSSYTREEGDGWVQIPIEEFWVLMDAPESQRNNFGMLRRRILEPSIDELRQKDNWIIEWHPIHAGKRVKGLRFKFQRNPQGALFQS
jgi:plasmid replication initiation protein